MCINDIAIERLLDMGVAMSVITPESWHPDCALQETVIQPYLKGTKHEMG